MRDARAIPGCARCEALRARRGAGYCCLGVDQPPAAGALPERVPMTEATLVALRRRAADLEDQVKRLAPEAASDALDGITHAGFFVASRQLSALDRLLTHAYVVEPDGCVLVGSRVTVALGDGAERLAVELATPDVVDPAVGRISVDSPMGGALLGRRTGEAVRFHTPAGYRTVTLTAID